MGATEKSQSESGESNSETIQVWPPSSSSSLSERPDIALFLHFHLPIDVEVIKQNKMETMKVQKKKTEKKKRFLLFRKCEASRRVAVEIPKGLVGFSTENKRLGRVSVPMSCCRSIPASQLSDHTNASLFPTCCRSESGGIGASGTMLRWQSITRLLVIRGTPCVASRRERVQLGTRSTQQVRMVNKKASISNSSRHTESEDVMVTIMVLQHYERSAIEVTLTPPSLTSRF